MPDIAPPDPAGQVDLGAPQFASHKWVEPIVIVSIMLFSCYINRRPGYPITPQSQGQSLGLLDQDHDPEHDTLEPFDEERDLSEKHLPKQRQCFGLHFTTPNTSRFANYRHSRFLQKFPFLIEMFYWAFNYCIYVSAKGLGELIFSTDGIWELAEAHGIQVLKIEHDSPVSFLFPPKEIYVQQFFMNGRQAMLSFLNRNYSWVHIPATISFLTWYYYAAPTHAHFAAVRRMMTLTNTLDRKSVV